MTDPIKEQAEKVAKPLQEQFMAIIKRFAPNWVPHLIDSDENDGQRFRDSILETIEKHLLEKEELRKSLKAAQDEVERLKAEAGYHDAKDVIDQLSEIVKHLEAHNLQLVEACRDFLLVCSSMNTAKHRERIVDWDDEPILPQRKEWVEYFLEEKSLFESALQSPAGKRYALMLEVVEATRKFKKQFEAFSRYQTQHLSKGIEQAEKCWNEVSDSGMLDFTNLFKALEALEAAQDENELLRKKVEETILYPHPKELQEKIKSLQDEIAHEKEHSDDYRRFNQEAGEKIKSLQDEVATLKEKLEALEGADG